MRAELFRRGRAERPEPWQMIERKLNYNVDTFEGMMLNENLLRGIFESGLEKPSAIQKQAIGPCIKGW